ncbi:MAG: hypothetical protein AAF721_04400 [Myxococcota bacterium]
MDAEFSGTRGLRLEHAARLSDPKAAQTLASIIDEPELGLEVSGAYIARPPVAAISVVSQPSDCELPVAFVARSVDPDKDPLTHVWSTEMGVSDTGKLFEVLLEGGEHEIRLASADPGGRTGTATLRYHRRCS